MYLFFFFLHKNKDDIFHVIVYDINLLTVTAKYDYFFYHHVDEQHILFTYRVLAIKYKKYVVYIFVQRLVITIGHLIRRKGLLMEYLPFHRKIDLFRLYILNPKHKSIISLKLSYQKYY